MNTSTTQTAKPSFYDIFTVYKYNMLKLQKLAKLSDVPFAIVEAMCDGDAVKRSDAEKVLTAFSQFTRREWTLGTVNVPVLLTFADLYELHHVDTVLFSKQSNIPLALVDQMLCDEKVAKNDATKVLDALSQQTGHTYTLDNVVVQLRDGEVQHD